MATNSLFGTLPPGWVVKRLAEVTTKVGSGSTPTGGEKAYLPKREKFALIRSQCVHDRWFDLQSVSFISEAQAKKLGNAAVQEGDVLLNITGDGVTFSRSAQVPVGVLPACVNQHVSIIRSDPSQLLPGFLLSYLTHPATKPYIEGFSSGGSRRAITKAHIQSFEVPLPPIDEQARIVELLGSLDDKIELNRRMNETLEAIAQAIFRDWFVDFGPTRRKLEGATGPAAVMGGLVQDATTAQALADLFPASFADNGLPDGWNIRAIGDLTEIVGGSTPATSSPEYWEGGTHLWATPRDLSRLEGLHLFDTERRVTEIGLRKISSGLSPSGTVLLSSRAPIGYLAIATGPTAVNQGFIAIRPSDELPTTFALCWCRENMALIKAHANGSTFQEISKGNFRPLPVIDGGRPLRRSLDELLTPMLELCRTRSDENRSLAATRDLLLPKLMSGEIRLREAEEMLEAAQ